MKRLLGRAFQEENTSGAKVLRQKQVGLSFNSLIWVKTDRTEATGARGSAQWCCCSQVPSTPPTPVSPSLPHI